MNASDLVKLTEWDNPIRPSSHKKSDTKEAEEMRRSEVVYVGTKWETAQYSGKIVVKFELEIPEAGLWICEVSFRNKVKGFWAITVDIGSNEYPMRNVQVGGLRHYFNSPRGSIIMSDLLEPISKATGYAENEIHYKGVVLDGATSKRLSDVFGERI